MTALAVLNGTVGMELQSRLAKEVSFETVKEKVRHELDLWADDPDLIELFDYVISLGATKNTFVSGLCEWAANLPTRSYGNVACRLSAKQTSCQSGRLDSSKC